MTPLVPLKVDLKESGLYIAALLPTCPKSPPTKNFIHLHPGRLTWNLKMMVWKMIFLFNWVIFRFHVILPGCRNPVKQKTTNNFSPQPRPAHQPLPAVLQRRWWIQETFKIFHHSRPICSINSDRRNPGKKIREIPQKSINQPINKSINPSIHPSINQPINHLKRSPTFYFIFGGRRFPQLFSGIRFTRGSVFYSPHSGMVDGLL